MMGKKHIDVSKEGFITVYPALDEPRYGCKFRNNVAAVFRWLKRKRKY